MKEESTKTTEDARRIYEELEALVRGKVQGFIQNLLEEEVTEFLGWFSRGLSSLGVGEGLAA